VDDREAADAGIEGADRALKQGFVHGALVTAAGAGADGFGGSVAAALEGAAGVTAVGVAGSGVFGAAGV
jgi:hypothetical protein